MSTTWGTTGPTCSVTTGCSPQHPITRVAGALENTVIRQSDAIIAHFPLVADRVALASTTPVHTIFNISLEADPDPGSHPPSGTPGPPTDQR